MDMNYGLNEQATESAPNASLSANERFAQLLVYLSPYLFWGTVGTLTGGIWLLQ
tara:strand:- start:32 stop:193 length:162 start_codon:yes stop_codon:yes gene_type:complete